MTQKMMPEMAIILYRGCDSSYLERRDIIDGVMQQGEPLSEECIRDIVSGLSAEESNLLHGAIPSNMLYCDPRTGFEKYVWYRHAEKRMLYFKESTGIPSGEMWVPPLLYVVEKNGMSMYSFTGGKPKDRLLQAPFMNVSSRYVCLGNVDREFKGDRTYEAIMAHWEKLFWNSEFVHLLDGNPIKGNLALLTKRLIETGERFPVRELKEVSITLKDILR